MQFKMIYKYKNHPKLLYFRLFNETMFHSTKLFKYLGNVSCRFARNFSSKGKIRCSFNALSTSFSIADALIKSPTTKPDTDKLLQNLRNSMSTKYVLELVSDHHKIMNNQHVLQALRSLFALQKSGKYVFTNRRF